MIKTFINLVLIILFKIIQIPLLVITAIMKLVNPELRKKPRRKKS